MMGNQVRCTLVLFLIWAVGLLFLLLYTKYYCTVNLLLVCKRRMEQASVLFTFITERSQWKTDVGVDLLCDVYCYYK